MSEDVLTDALWERRAPLVPVRPRRFRYPGRRPADDHTVLAGILFVLRYDLPWRYLPASFGVSEVTCGRRLRDWAKAGVWQQLHERLLAELRAASRLDLHRVLVESSHLPALKGGMPRLEPGHRAHPGSTHHLVTGAAGVPLAAIVTGGNHHDATGLIPLVEAIPPIRGR